MNDVNRKVWRACSSLDVARSHPAVSVHQDNIYVFGGGGPEFKSLNSSVVFESQSRQWRELTPMPSLRSGSVAVNYEGKLYVMGGGFKQPSGQFKFLTTVEIYDPATDRWETGPDLLQPHDYPAVSLHEGYIYVMGGHHPEAYKAGPKTDPGFDFCERLDPRTGQWEEIAPLPTPRFALSAVNDAGKILTFGGVAFSSAGFNNYDFVEVYDPGTGQWRRDDKYTLPWPAAGLAACLYKEAIYIFGGYSGDGIHNRCAVFTGNGWELLPEMPLPRAAMGVAATGEGIYIMGGWADDGRTPVADVHCLCP